MFDEAESDGPISPAVLRLALRLADDCLAHSSGGLDGIVSMSSRRRPLLLQSLVEGLSARTGLPMFGALTIAPLAQPGRANSARRVAALQDAFSVPVDWRRLVEARPLRFCWSMIGWIPAGR